MLPYSGAREDSEKNNEKIPPAPLLWGDAINLIFAIFDQNMNTCITLLGVTPPLPPYTGNPPCPPLGCA